jgi:hypothetical protein
VVLVRSWRNQLSPATLSHDSYPEGGARQAKSYMVAACRWREWPGSRPSWGAFSSVRREIVDATSSQQDVLLGWAFHGQRSPLSKPYGFEPHVQENAGDKTLKELHP